MWQSSLPSPNLRAVLLLDRCPDKRRYPFWHLDGLQSLVSVTAFVDTIDCSVRAFEFVYDENHVRAIGSSQDGAVRLSYYFTKGEVIESIGCAQAKKNTGIVIQVVSPTLYKQYRR